jgi:hypothetical protein
MISTRELLTQLLRNTHIRESIKNTDNFVKSYKKVINKEELVTDLEKEIDYRLYKQQYNRLWTIFLGCQKTKTYQIINRINHLINTNDKSVSIIMCQNDASLSLQTSERIHNIIPNKAKVFVLSSLINTRPNLDDDSIVYNPDFKILISYIIKFIAGIEGYLYPTIVSLSNDTQITKLISILEILQKPIIDGGYHLFIDEADVTYENLRSKILKYIVDNNNNINPKNYGTYWVTATGFNLINNRSGYNECKKAHQLDLVLLPDINDTYFDITDEKSIIHNIENKDFDILSILSNNDIHFKEKLKDGSYRKIIALSSRITEEQELLAIKIVEKGYNVITINTNGIVLHMMNNVKHKLSLNNDIKEVNKLLAIKYHSMIELKMKPLIIVGNRKIDRGVTFHYPSNDNQQLIFTDILIPRINSWRRAIQVAGRCAGIIKNDTFNNIHYWIEDKTYKRIIKYLKYSNEKLANIYGYKTIEELLNK